MWYRYEGNLRQAIFRAEAIRQSEGLAALSTRHLLLGVAAHGWSAVLLSQRNLTGRVRHATPRQAEPQAATGPYPSLTPAARTVVDQAYREASFLGENEVRTEHFLLALLRFPDTEAFDMLSQAGLTLESTAHDLLRHQEWRTKAPEGIEPPSDIGLGWRRIRAEVQKRGKLLRRIALALTQVFDDPVVGSFLFTKQRLERPYLFFRRLRQRGFYRSRAAGGWVVSSYEMVQAALKEPNLSARRFDVTLLSDSPPLSPFVDREFNVLCGGLTRQMLFLDAPEQTRTRSLVSRQFTPRVLAAIRTQIESIADSLLDAVADRERMDLLADYSFPLPATVIARLLGVDDSDLTQFKTWSDAFVQFLSQSDTLAQDLLAYESIEKLTLYFREAVARVRARPDDSVLLSLLANATDDDGSRLTEDEVIMNALLLLAAGHETTTHLIGNGLYLLFRHPEARARLQADPSGMPAAVEEMLRCEGPVQWTNRIARTEFVLNGVTIRRGENVNIALAAANRDPVRFPDPDRFAIDRTDNKHLAFGYGAHFCLGAALARMETEIALNTLLRRFPAIRPADPKYHWRHDFTFRAQKNLPVLLTPGGSESPVV